MVGSQGRFMLGRYRDKLTFYGYGFNKLRTGATAVAFRGSSPAPHRAIKGKIAYWIFFYVLFLPSSTSQ
jgi:hypothetical protein